MKQLYQALFSINITMNLYVHVTDDEKMKEMQKFEDYAMGNGVK